MSKLYGLIGYPLAHSLSAEYFADKFRNEAIQDCEYRLFPINTPGELHTLLRKHLQLSGLNVTIPLKKSIMDELQDITPEARRIGAVNCIRITRDDNRIKTKGYNTDAPAFAKSILPLLKDHHKKALVLGTGGSASAVCHVLQQEGIPCLSISRDRTKGSTGYKDLDRIVMEEHQVVINTTPLGMAPADQTSPPIPYRYLTKRHLLFDLVYNPPCTLFMTRGKAAGAEVYNGYEMLCLQAEMSWAIWQS